jgi:hypothetical protein
VPSGLFMLGILVPQEKLIKIHVARAANFIEMQYKLYISGLLF